jgi:hypothetical protein
VLENGIYSERKERQALRLGLTSVDDGDVVGNGVYVCAAVPGCV